LRGTTTGNVVLRRQRCRCQLATAPDSVAKRLPGMFQSAHR
jgi:hypothetical protein